MKKRTLSLFGYVYRMNNKGLIKIVVTGMASGKKRRGRLYSMGSISYSMAKTRHLDFNGY